MTGVAHPRLTYLLHMVNLTAEKRVRAIFYWAHVLGTNAEVITPAVRTPALVAVSTLQLILIASRGHRPYSQKELDIIYVQVGHQFFTNLETLAEFVDSERMATGARAHARNPTTTRPPIPFKRMRRYICFNHNPIPSYICILQNKTVCACKIFLQAHVRHGYISYGA